MSRKGRPEGLLAPRFLGFVARLELLLEAVHTVLGKHLNEGLRVEHLGRVDALELDLALSEQERADRERYSDRVSGRAVSMLLVAVLVVELRPDEVSGVPAVLRALHDGSARALRLGLVSEH